MPFVFRTGKFCSSAGLSPSSASRALRGAAAQGVVARVGRGLWRRTDCDAPAVECRTPHPFPPAWMNANEHLLDAAFGPAPRRLSHLMALEAAGVPLVTGQQLSVPHHSTTTMPLGITVFTERHDRIALHAAQLTERTWMSSPTRAAVETAQHDVAAPGWEERIAWAFTEDDGVLLDADEAVEISDTLQMRAGLRRLSSIADTLRRLGTAGAGGDLSNVLNQWAETATARRGDTWIRLRRSMPAPRSPSEAAWVDRERKVLWHWHPEALAASLTT